MQETPVQFLGQEDPTPVFLGFLGGTDNKESAYNVGDLGSIPGFGRSPGGGHDNPLQYSCFENPHGQRSLENPRGQRSLENPRGQRSLVGYSPWGHKESDKTERLSIAQYRKEEYGIWK